MWLFDDDDRGLENAGGTPHPAGRDFVISPNPSVDAPVDLRHWDIVLVNTSGGKDSQTILHQVAKLAKRQGALDRVVAIHADLKTVEWPGAATLAAKHAKMDGLSRHIIAPERPQGNLLKQVLDRAKKLKRSGRMKSNPYPAVGLAQYCTSDQKRGQIRPWITRLVTEWRKRKYPGVKVSEAPAASVLNVMGMRGPESPRRQLILERDGPLKRDDGASSSRREVWDWWAIANWEDGEVWEDIKASGLPYHRAYDIGMPRLSCMFCFFATRAGHVLAGGQNRPLLERYVQLERQLEQMGFGDVMRPKPGHFAGVLADVKAGKHLGPLEIDSWEM